MRSQFVSPVFLPSLSRVGWRFAASSAGACTSICVSILFFAPALAFVARRSPVARGYVLVVPCIVCKLLPLLVSCSFALLDCVNPQNFLAPCRGACVQCWPISVSQAGSAKLSAQDLCAEAMPSSLHPHSSSGTHDLPWAELGIKRVLGQLHWD